MGTLYGLLLAGFFRRWREGPNFNVVTRYLWRL